MALNISKIKQIMARLKIGNKDLFLKSGVPLKTINNILGGTTTNPTIDILISIAHALNCKVADECIWLNESMSSTRKACVLAEELGHYHTTVGNILNQDDTNNRKQERTAHKWSYEKIIPIENIQFAVADGHTEI